MNMKTSTPRWYSHKNLISLLAVFVVLAASSTAQAQQLAARPLTPQEIHDTWGEVVPDNVHISNGLMNVGVGEPVYLEAQVPSGTEVSGVVWSIEEMPLNASSAMIMDSPLPESLDIYSPGDREVLDVADRKLFIPDVEGRWMIQAVISTDGDPITVSSYVTGALYVGVGTIDGMDPSFPECGVCHGENTVDWGKTGHATFFERAIDNQIDNDHYNESCIECHVLGKDPMADNGSFLSIAENIGWEFPAVLEPGNWAGLPDELKAKANIQCEHCHGAGSMHQTDFAELTTMSVSLSSGDCGACHDEQPYHAINQQWNISNHSVATRYPTGPGRGSCVECHSGIGFIEEMDGVAEKSTDYEAIVCAACHDPHSAENKHQLRTLADVTLENGEVITEGGTGKFCLNCHKSRRDADQYVQGNVSSHYGPHYGIQGDLFHGTNVIEYGKVDGRPSGHLYALEDSCVSCHMQPTNANDTAGGHTWKMASDNGTPDDPSDDIDHVAGCIDCHGEIESFDDFTADLNYDGKAEPIQEEVHHLLHALSMYLPPVGEPEVVRDSSIDYTDAQKKALYNYMAVEEDNSFGLHNPKYISAILKASVNDLADPYNAIFGGLNVPVGGEWFYSEWFEFYAPTQWEGWIYHYEHGYLKPELRDDGNIWIYDLATKTWRYTNPDIYPIMYVPAEDTWIYYGGKFNATERAFYNFSTGKWGMTK